MVPPTYLPLKSFTCLFAPLCSNACERGGFLKLRLLTMADQLSVFRSISGVLDQAFCQNLPCGIILSKEEFSENG